MSQITVDRVRKWDNILSLPPGAAGPVIRSIRSIQRRPVRRQINHAPSHGYADYHRLDEEPERWDGMS